MTLQSDRFRYISTSIMIERSKSMHAIPKLKEGTPSNMLEIPPPTKTLFYQFSKEQISTLANFLVMLSTLLSLP